MVAAVRVSLRTVHDIALKGLATYFSASRLAVAPLLVAGAAAVAIAAAPLAAASPLTCTDVGSATACSSPGNSQIVATTPLIQQQPQIIIIHRDRR